MYKKEDIIRAGDNKKRKKNQTRAFRGYTIPFTRILRLEESGNGRINECKAHRVGA